MGGTPLALPMHVTAFEPGGPETRHNLDFAVGRHGFLRIMRKAVRRSRLELQGPGSVRQPD